MSKRSYLAAAVALVFAVAAPAAVQAQSVYVGGGGLFGVGDFGDLTDPGFMGIAGLSFDLGESGASVGVEGSYGQANGADIGDVEALPDVNVYSAMGYILYGFGDGEAIAPYVFGGAGLLGTDIDTTDTSADGETEFGWQGGVGLDIPVGDRVGIFVEGRYMGSSDIDMLGLLAGLGIGLGG